MAYRCNVQPPESGERFLHHLHGVLDSGFGPDPLADNGRCGLQRFAANQFIHGGGQSRRVQFRPWNRPRPYSQLVNLLSPEKLVRDMRDDQGGYAGSKTGASGAVTAVVIY